MRGWTLLIGGCVAFALLAAPAAPYDDGARGQDGSAPAASPAGGTPAEGAATDPSDVGSADDAPTPELDSTLVVGDQSLDGRLGQDAVAHAAASRSVRIIDFNFQPSKIEVVAGDTITWTNSGDEPHTATADNDSFDTGRLRPGDRKTLTFDDVGEIPYVCEIHPSMEGTVTVVPADNGGGGGGSGGTSPSGSGGGGGATTSGSGFDTGSTASDGGSLPLTGEPLLTLVLIGTGLLSLGLALRGLSWEL